MNAKIRAPRTPRAHTPPRAGATHGPRARGDRSAFFVHALAHPFFMLVVGALATGCGNDNGGPIRGGITPATCPDPTFSSLHAQVFGKPTCASPGCHGGGSPAAGLDLSLDASAARAQLLGPTTSGLGASLFPERIVPGSPKESFLVERVTTSTAPGGLMPPGGPMLSACQIDALRRWIREGALDN